MHKLVVLYPHPSDPAEFARYYRESHLPLARQLPAVLDMRFSLNVGSPAGDSPYFAVFEADFQDESALIAATSSPEGLAVAADVPNYATGGAILLTYEVQEV